MSLYLWTNNASSLLASGILSTDTSLTVTATQGAEFPAPGAGQVAMITLEDVSGNIEITKCTGRTGDTLTIVRAQEGTTALAFASGSRVEKRITAGELGALLQKNGGDTMTGTTLLTGVLDMASAGSIQGGEYAGGFVRSAPGVTAGQIYVSGGIPKSGSDIILTTGNIAANMPSGTGIILSQMILMWAGTTFTIPAGWFLCDGSHSTPDLRDLFIVGGGGALPTSGTFNAPTAAAASAPDVINAHALTTSELAAHQHPFDYAFANGTDVIGDPGFSLPAFYLFGGGGTGNRRSYAGSSTGSGTGHTHTASTGGTHTHPQAIPYKAVLFIMKS